MKLYLYDKASGEVRLEVDGVLSYTDQAIVTEAGVHGPLADSCELSSTADCSETLRADWLRDNPTTQTRIEELETLVAELLFGGEGV